MVDAGQRIDGDLLREIVGLFDADNLPQFNALEAACREGDAAAVARIAHYIAGSSANLGLVRLAAFCREVESAMGNDDEIDMAALSPTFWEEYRRARGSLKSHFPELRD